MKTTTSQRSFGGANIKGTPAMSADAVRNDLRVLKKRLDIIALQEFKWRWYWRVLGVLLNPTWNSFPSAARGMARPVRGAQGVLWKASLCKRVATRQIAAFNFDQPHGGIMDDRWMRAALLADRATGLRCWYGSTHFVVGGDSAGDSPRRKTFLKQNLGRLDDLFHYLTRTGEPVVFELDANIHRGSWAYPELVAIVKRYRGRIVGEHGVEFLIVIDGDRTKVVVDREYVLTPRGAGLKTDHEVRCIDHHLATKEAS